MRKGRRPIDRRKTRKNNEMYKTTAAAAAVAAASQMDACICISGVFPIHIDEM